MKKLFTVILTAPMLILFFQNCSKKLEAVAGFALVEKIPVGSNAVVLGDAYGDNALSGAEAQSMMWLPSYNKIELNLKDDTIKQSYYRPGQYEPELSSETTCDVSQERAYQTLKALLLKQEICTYASTIKEEDRDWGKCPMYMMSSQADSYAFSLFIPESASHAATRIGFMAGGVNVEELDPHCTPSVQVFCSESQGEIMDQLVKDLTDRFDTYSNCISTPVPAITKN